MMNNLAAPHTTVCADKPRRANVDRTCSACWPIPPPLRNASPSFLRRIVQRGKVVDQAAVESATVKALREKTQLELAAARERARSTRSPTSGRPLHGPCARARARKSREDAADAPVVVTAEADATAAAELRAAIISVSPSSAATAEAT